MKAHEDTDPELCRVPIGTVSITQYGMIRNNEAIGCTYVAGVHIFLYLHMNLASFSNGLYTIYICGVTLL